MEQEITQAVKNNIVRRVSIIGPQKPLSIDPRSFLIVKVHRRGPFPPPVVSAFAPLAAASASRPDNSPSNPRGGKGAAERERRRERSAHPRPGTGVGAEIFPWRFEAFCQGCKSGPACGEGWKGERVDGRWWKEGEELILDGRLACGMCRLTTPFESVDGCAPLWQRLFRKPAGYETDLARLRKRGERGRIKC